MKRPTGVTIIVILLFLGGVANALSPGDIYFHGIGTFARWWRFYYCAIFIAVGVGLLTRFRWARIAAIALATLRIGLNLVGLPSGIRESDVLFMTSCLIGVPRDGLIIWYLLKPDIGRTFVRPARDHTLGYFRFHPGAPPIGKEGGAAMTFKDSIERHPVKVIATTVVATAATVAAFMGYFTSQRIDLLNRKHELELQESQSQLAFIHRDLGDAQDLDIRSFIHQRGQEGNIRLSPGSTFFAGDNFYATSDTQRWKHEMISEGQLMTKLEGEEVPEFLKASAAHLIHLWRDPSFVPYERDPSFASLGAFITLDRMPIDELVKVTRQVAKAPNTSSTEKPPTATEAASIDTELDQMEKQFRGDLSGTMLAYQLEMSNHMAESAPDVSFEIVKLQKVGRVVYTQFLSTVRNVTVGGLHYEKYFLRQESILVSDQTTLYQITAYVPTGDPSPRGRVYSNITEWFSKLALFIG